ncbi:MULTISPECIES: hypothetical protein [unclassified Delftia]|jgi:hypothetical protein|uniref:hypothetical protein n=1 Tax=unclassified Delftia TaxID=2613839 RepID=UPI0011548BF2|nr:MULTISPECIES: hypothetical protein [unclassified Delftia]MCB4789444.1 hypothetical protein [Delftia sp. Lp-1]
MPNFSQLFGGSGGIKNVQRGATSPGSTQVNVTISAVNPAKAFVNILTSHFFPQYESRVSVRILNSTTLVVESYVITNTTTFAPAIAWEVVEFN